MSQPRLLYCAASLSFSFTHTHTLFHLLSALLQLLSSSLSLSLLHTHSCTRAPALHTLFLPYFSCYSGLISLLHSPSSLCTDSSPSVRSLLFFHAQVLFCSIIPNFLHYSLSFFRVFTVPPHLNLSTVLPPPLIISANL